MTQQFMIWHPKKRFLFRYFAVPVCLNGTHVQILSISLRCVILGPHEGPRRIAATHAFLRVPPGPAIN